MACSPAALTAEAAGPAPYAAETSQTPNAIAAAAEEGADDKWVDNNSNNNEYLSEAEYIQYQVPLEQQLLSLEVCICLSRMPYMAYVLAYTRDALISWGFLQVPAVLHGAKQYKRLHLLHAATAPADICEYSLCLGELLRLITRADDM